MHRLTSVILIAMLAAMSTSALSETITVTGSGSGISSFQREAEHDACTSARYDASRSAPPGAKYGECDCESQHVAQTMWQYHCFVTATYEAVPAQTEADPENATAALLKLMMLSKCLEAEEIEASPMCEELLSGVSSE